MSAITRILFPAPAVRRSPETLLVWWESRRPLYNLIVGTTGLVTLAALQLLSWLPPHFPFAPPWQVVVVYGVAANVCYTFGYLIELLLDQMWGSDVRPVGPVLFRQGLVFSVGLSLIPVGMALGMYVLGAIRLALN